MAFAIHIRTLIAHACNTSLQVYQVSRRQGIDTDTRASILHAPDAKESDPKHHTCVPACSVMLFRDHKRQPVHVLENLS